jgi:hypothetical protein
LGFSEVATARLPQGIIPWRFLRFLEDVPQVLIDIPMQKNEITKYKN